MYRWYQKSDICCIYMADVVKNPSERESHFRHSRYWTRGWTLQELLAPEQHVVFYDHSWTPIGVLEDLIDIISEITHIPLQVLTHAHSVHNCSVAQRFSWAANRRTTRSEDIAYSLMGLFNVNMPLLYGEGEKAFVRLQEEILKDSSDQTIFCWTEDEPLDIKTLFKTQRRLDVCGVLATHPRFFRRSAGLEAKSMGYMDDIQEREIASTNLGLKLTAPIRNYGYFLAAELAVIAQSPSKGIAARVHASWALPANHVCIILWPEPGDKGRLMRVRQAPFTLKSQLPTVQHKGTSPTIQLLKSNWSLRHFYLSDFRIVLLGKARDNVSIIECLYAPFPFTQLTIFQTIHEGETWSYWTSNIGGETIILVKLRIGKDVRTSSKKTPQMPSESNYTLVAWAHPVIGSQCAIICGDVDRAKHARLIIQTLTGGLDFCARTKVPGIGSLTFQCVNFSVVRFAEGKVSKIVIDDDEI